MPENPKCECRTRRCEAKILYADGQEISKGLLTLSTDRGRGQFVPTQMPTRQTEETQVIAIIGQGKYSHQHRLLKWKYSPDLLFGGEGGPFLGFFEFDRDE